MSFVPDTNAGPRILPKVFADVPSANELAEAKTEAAAARSSRNLLLLVVVLLLGMLIAAGGAVFYFQEEARKLETETSEKLEKAELDAETAKAEYTELNEKYEALVNDATELGEQYSIINKRINRNEELRGSIQGVFDKNPRAKTNIPKNKAYNAAINSPAWTTLRVEVEDKLLQEQKTLEQALKAAQDTKKGSDVIIFK